MTSIVSHQYAFSFHKKPVCNLIKREVSKSTKESSIDLCNSSPNAASIFPSIFPLPLGRNSIVRIDAPKCKKQRNRRFVDTRAHTVHLRVHRTWIHSRTIFWDGSLFFSTRKGWPETDRSNFLKKMNFIS